MAIIYTVEGNIGSGKSTLVKILKKLLPQRISATKFIFLQEPVDIWNTIKDSDGKTIIEKFYSNQEKYSFPFQMMAYISRLSILRTALKQNYDIIFTERSLLTDKNVFAKMLYDDKKINEIEYQIYNNWFHEFIAEFPEIEFIYVKTQPEIADERILKRAREGETIPLEYLKTCHEYHENWLINHKNKYYTIIVYQT